MPPGKSLANTYPAYTDIDWQISLAEDATATVTLPTNLTENELAAAMDAACPCLWTATPSAAI